MNYTTFIEGLTDKLQISLLPEEEQAEIITTLSENILTRTNLAIASMLDEDEARIINEFLEQGMLEEVMDFLGEKHPELDETVIAISNEVVAEFLGESQ